MARNADPVLDPVLRSRFAQDLGAIIGPLEGKKIGLAVSGGPDSLALLLLAQGCGVTCEVATVDHALREDSSTEAAYVSGLSAALGLPHATLVLEPPASRSNVMEWARKERYAALEHWRDHIGADYIVTAHHADDQLETMIMRLNRGSGVAGLSGIRRRNGRIIRPLLDWTKAELETLVTQAGFVAIDDPSNRNDRFDRARLRKALAGADWLDPQAAARSADALGEAEEALGWAAKAWFNRRCAEKGGIVSLDPRDLPRELLRRVTLMCIQSVMAQAAPRGAELDRLITGLASGKTATLGGVRCSGGVFWLFEAAPPRRKN